MVDVQNVIKKIHQYHDYTIYIALLNNAKLKQTKSNYRQTTVQYLLSITYQFRRLEIYESKQITPQND